MNMRERIEAAMAADEEVLLAAVVARDKDAPRSDFRCLNSWCDGMHRFDKRVEDQIGRAVMTKDIFVCDCCGERMYTLR